jgi:hypothetical protein
LTPANLLAKLWACGKWTAADVELFMSPFPAQASINRTLHLHAGVIERLGGDDLAYVRVPERPMAVLLSSEMVFVTACGAVHLIVSHPTRSTRARRVLG